MNIKKEEGISSLFHVLEHSSGSGELHRSPPVSKLTVRALPAPPEVAEAAAEVAEAEAALLPAVAEAAVAEAEVAAEQHGPPVAARS